jgi:hypothetical protein
MFKYGVYFFTSRIGIAENIYRRALLYRTRCGLNLVRVVNNGIAVSSVKNRWEEIPKHLPKLATRKPVVFIHANMEKEDAGFFTAERQRRDKKTQRCPKNRYA